MIYLPKWLYHLLLPSLESFLPNSWGYIIRNLGLVIVMAYLPMTINPNLFKSLLYLAIIGLIMVIIGQLMLWTTKYFHKIFYTKF